MPECSCYGWLFVVYVHIVVIVTRIHNHLAGIRKQTDVCMRFVVVIIVGGDTHNNNNDNNTNTNNSNNNNNMSA